MKRIPFYIILLLSFTGCSAKNEMETTSQELIAITSSINHSKKTMSILYGNDPAITDLKANSTIKKQVAERVVMAERIIVLVTWTQKQDPYWYGAKVPGKLLSKESIKTNHTLSQRKGIRYQVYNAENLPTTREDKDTRINNILSMKPVLFPNQ